MICGVPFMAHTDPLFVRTKTLKYNDIYQFSATKLAFNIINNNALPVTASLFDKFERFWGFIDDAHCIARWCICWWWCTPDFSWFLAWYAFSTNILTSFQTNFEQLKDYEIKIFAWCAHIIHLQKFSSTFQRK